MRATQEPPPAVSGADSQCDSWPGARQVWTASPCSTPAKCPAEISVVHVRQTATHNRLPPALPSATSTDKPSQQTLCHTGRSFQHTHLPVLARSHMGRSHRARLWNPVLTPRPRPTSQWHPPAPPTASSSAPAPTTKSVGGVSSPSHLANSIFAILLECLTTERPASRRSGSCHQQDPHRLIDHPVRCRANHTAPVQGGQPATPATQAATQAEPPTQARAVEDTVASEAAAGVENRARDKPQESTSSHTGDAGNTLRAQTSDQVGGFQAGLCTMFTAATTARVAQSVPLYLPGVYACK